MKKYITISFLVICLIPNLFAQANKELSFPEQQVFKKGAKDLIKDFYHAISHFKDSASLRPKYTPEPEPDPDAETDAGFQVIKVPYEQLLIDYFFENNDIYLYNDLAPEGGSAPRVMLVTEYLQKSQEFYKDGMTITLDKMEVGEIKYNSKSMEPYFYAKVKITRTMKGNYMGTTFINDTREFDFYIKTIDRQFFKLKKFKVISTDKESRQIVDNYDVPTGIAKGMLAFDTGDYERAFQLLIKRKGERKLKRNENATAALAYMYFFGWGTPDGEPNFDEMKTWILLAADRNNKYALYSLGDLYYMGQYGFEENDKEAMKAYKKSARKGLPKASFMVGEMYEKGHGSKKNMRKAKRWYKKGAKKGDKKCQAAMKRLGEKW